MSPEYVSFTEIFVEASDRLDRVEENIVSLNKTLDHIEQRNLVREK